MCSSSRMLLPRSARVSLRLAASRASASSSARSWVVAFSRVRIGVISFAAVLKVVELVARAR